MMTSNLASDEIASHALQLRREAAQAAQDYHHSQTGEREPVVDNCLTLVAASMLGSYFIQHMNPVKADLQVMFCSLLIACVGFGNPSSHVLVQWSEG